MGCDIHGPWLYTRQKIMTGATLGTYYTRCRATFHWERDYDVFALLANVRNDNRYVSISEPRGWPSVEWFGGHDPWEMEDHGDSDGCHSASWVSTDELVGAQKFYTSIGDGIVLISDSDNRHPRPRRNGDLAWHQYLIRCG